MFLTPDTLIVGLTTTAFSDFFTKLDTLGDLIQFVFVGLLLWALGKQVSQASKGGGGTGQIGKLVGLACLILLVLIPELGDTGLSAVGTMMEKIFDLGQSEADNVSF